MKLKGDLGKTVNFFKDESLIAGWWDTNQGDMVGEDSNQGIMLVGEKEAANQGIINV